MKNPAVEGTSASTDCRDAQTGPHDPEGEKTVQVAHVQYTAKTVDVSVVPKCRMLNATTQAVDRPVPVPQEMIQQRRVPVTK